MLTSTVFCLLVPVLMLDSGIAVVKCASVFTEENKYELLTTCICPGHDIVFQCTVTGPGATLWKGTYFDLCTNGQITVRHSQFTDMSETILGNQTCGTNGSVFIGRTVESMNDTFTSELTIRVSDDAEGHTVECAHNNGTDVVSIGVIQLMLTADFLPPPANISISNITQGNFTFTWDPVSNNCPAVHYIIISNCGNCPTITTSNSATCTNVSKTKSAYICTFTMQTAVCANILGTASNPIAILVEGPAPPIFNFLRLLSNRRIMISFNTSHSHTQYHTVNISTTSYTIIYYNSISNVKCGDTTILASECVGETCSHVYDIPLLCSNSTTLLLTVFATNILGGGRESEPIRVILSNIADDKQEMKENSSTHYIIIVCSILGGLTAVVVLILVPVFLIRYYKNLHLQHYSGGQNAGIRDEVLDIHSMSTTEEVNHSVGVYSTIHDDTNNEAYTSEQANQTGRPTLASINQSTDFIANQGAHYSDDSNSEPNQQNQHSGLESMKLYENTFHEIDKSLTLDNLLIQIRRQVTPKWYQFGLAVGINKETLDEFSNFPPEECTVEILDLWLRTNETTVTWRNVADALKEIGFHRLAEKVLKVYKTGKLESDIHPHNIVHPYEGVEQLSPPSLAGSDGTAAACPPLPPKTYQCTSELTGII